MATKRHRETAWKRHSHRKMSSIRDTQNIYGTSKLWWKQKIMTKVTTKTQKSYANRDTRKHKRGRHKCGHGSNHERKPGQTGRTTHIQEKPLSEEAVWSVSPRAKHARELPMTDAASFCRACVSSSSTAQVLQPGCTNFRVVLYVSPGR